MNLRMQFRATVNKKDASLDLCKVVLAGVNETEGEEFCSQRPIFD